MGPLELLVLAFPGTGLDVGAMGALAQLRKSGDVRLIDSLVVTKQADGAVATAELDEIPALRGVAGGHDLAALIDAEDADEVAQTLDPDTTALVMLMEHRWAADAAAAVLDAGGRIHAAVRIPAAHIEELS